MSSDSGIRVTIALVGVIAGAGFTAAFDVGNKLITQAEFNGKMIAEVERNNMSIKWLSEQLVKAQTASFNSCYKNDALANN